MISSVRIAILGKICPHVDDRLGQYFLTEHLDSAVATEQLLSKPPFDAFVVSMDGDVAELVPCLERLRHAGIVGAGVGVYSRSLYPSIVRELQRHGTIRMVSQEDSDDVLRSAVNAASEASRGAHGQIYGLSLIDLLQAYHYSCRTLQLSLSGAVNGYIGMVDGEVVHAEAGMEYGSGAFQRILEVAGMTVAISPLHDCPTTITAPFDGLVLDTLRRIDESGVRASHNVSTPPPATKESLFLPALRETLTRYCPDASAVMCRPEQALTWLMGDHSPLPEALLTHIGERASHTLGSWQWIERLTPHFGAAVLDMGDDESVALFTPIDTKSSIGRFRTVTTKIYNQLQLFRDEEPLSRRSMDMLPASIRVTEPYDDFCRAVVTSDLNKEVVACAMWDAERGTLGGSYHHAHGATIPEQTWHLLLSLLSGELAEALEQLVGESTGVPVDVLVRSDEFFFFGRLTEAAGDCLFVATSRRANIGMISLNMRNSWQQQLDEWKRYLSLGETASAI